MLRGFNISILLFFFLCIFCGRTVYAQNIIHDLKEDFYFFNESAQGFVGFKQSTSTTNTNFDLDLEKYSNRFLGIEVEKECYLFSGSALVQKIPAGTTFLPIDNLKKYSDVESINTFTIYASSEFTNVEAYISASDVKTSKREEAFNTQTNSGYSNFFTIASFLLFAMFVLMKLFNAETMGQYMNLSRTFSLKNVEEGIFKSKLFDNTNILLGLYISLTLGFLITIMTVTSPDQLKLQHELKDGASLISYVSQWLIFSAIVLFVLILKAVLVSIMSSVFNNGKAKGVHNANYFRILFLCLLCVFFIATIVHYTRVSITIDYLQILILSMFVTAFVVFVKLSNMVSHSFLHLFAYLCATEIIPTVYLFKMVLR